MRYDRRRQNKLARACAPSRESARGAGCAPRDIQGRSSGCPGASWPRGVRADLGDASHNRRTQSGGCAIGAVCGTCICQRPIPAVAVLPVAIITLGIGPSMQIPIAAYGAMWPLLYGARAGVTEADPMWSDACRSFGIAKWSYVRRVVLPAALPSILTGLRIAVVVSLAVSVGVELVMEGGGGLGQY